MNTSSPPKDAPPQPKFILSGEEVKALPYMTERFLFLAGVLMQNGPTPAYDTALTDLQRMRPLLSKLTPISDSRKILSPVSVLDQASKKIFPTLVAILETARLCLFAGHFLSDVLRQCLNQPIAPQEPEKAAGLTAEAGDGPKTIN